MDKEKEEIRVVCYGVGAVGSRIARFLLEKQGVRIVGAIDVAKDKVGKDLGQVLEIGKKLGVTVSDDIDNVMKKACADVVVHATSSYLRDVYSQIAPVATYGVNVVSTCEELSYPYLSEPELAKKLEALGVKYAMSFLGTGINPGFLMDTLVITLTGVCQKIDKIKVKRVMNAATRRVPFQKKVGAGLTVAEFKKKMATKEITGHVGLAQSIGMVAAALRWQLDKIQVEQAEPVIAKEEAKSEAITVKKGQVAGLRQIARGVMKRKDAITLDFQAYIGAREEYDAITIDGVPPVHQKISPCVHGDLATVAIIVNSIPKVMNATPGLLTMKDLPVPVAAVEDMRKYL
ncbi:MAG TPA: dihydrodipicolinate reductase [Candidatus Bathyarchaeia archaeon]|nr:dihydrodipicolinate reductase [Candidatus Bathyarchaeia archaeon]